MSTRRRPVTPQPDAADEGGHSPGGSGRGHRPSRGHTEDAGRGRRWRTLRDSRPHAGPLLAMTLIWVMLWRDVSPGNILVGLLLAVIISVTFPLPQVLRTFRVRPWPFLVLLLRFLADVTRASLEVAYSSVAPWRHPAGRFTMVRLRVKQDLLRTVTAELTSLVPGSLVVDLDRDSGVLMLHLFDAPDDDAVGRAVARVHKQEERLMRAFHVEEVS